MNSYLGVVCVLFMVVLCTQGYIYQFQQDGYLMRGCPRIRDCPGRKIESKCRMPTTFITESGRKCRGCPRNFCTNNMFRALRTPGTNSNAIYNPLKEKVPGQSPEVFTAMRESYLNPNYRYNPVRRVEQRNNNNLGSTNLGRFTQGPRLVDRPQIVDSNFRNTHQQLVNNGFLPQEPFNGRRAFNEPATVPSPQQLSHDPLFDPDLNGALVNDRGLWETLNQMLVEATSANRRTPRSASDVSLDTIVEVLPKDEKSGCLH